MILSPLLLGLIPTISFQEPLKVYILAGQSNMEGHAHVRVLDYMGEDPATAPMLAEMKNPDGNYRLIPGAWISFLTGVSGRIDGENREVHGQLTAGYGSQVQRNYSKPGERIGPELAFGITMQKGLNQPVLIIKTAWGGQSLHTDFRSPSSGPYAPTEDDIKHQRFETKEQKEKLVSKTGARYHQMVNHVRFVLQDIQRVYPDYNPKRGFELAGFVWFQGFNDMVGRNVYPLVPPNHPTPRFANYTKWFANFVRDVRKDLAAPGLPFVMCVMGVGGADADAGNQAFRFSQAAIADIPKFRGNVLVVPTAPYWDEALAKLDRKRVDIRQKQYLLKTKNSNHENADGSMTPEDIQRFLTEFEKELFTAEDYALEKRGKSNAGYHYLGSAKTYSLIGVAAAEALLKKKRSPIQIISDDGGWCWFQDERALAIDGQVFIGSVAQGNHDPSRKGDIDLNIWTPSNGDVKTIEIHDQLQADDHNNPGMVQLANGNIVGSYSKHGSDSISRSFSLHPNHDLELRRCNLPDAERGITYANMHLMPNGDIINFFRGNGWDPNLIRSRDGGETWQQEGQLLGGPGRPYVKYSSHEGRVHFVATEQHPRDFDNSLYHGYWQGGVVYLSDGSVAGHSGDSPPGPEDLTTVFRGSAEGVAWPVDLELSDSYQPVCLLSVQVDGVGLDHRYYYATYKEGRWDTMPLAHAGSRLYKGEDDYTGLGAIVPWDTQQVYISTDAHPVTGETLISNRNGQCHYEIFHGVTDDSGSSWSWTAITEDSIQDNIRPIVPPGNTHVLLWLRGRLNTYTKYDLQIVGLEID